jgi:hypothetical protein
MSVSAYSIILPCGYFVFCGNGKFPAADAVTAVAAARPSITFTKFFI